MSGELCSTLGGKKRVKVRETSWVGGRYCRIKSRGSKAGNACWVGTETRPGSRWRAASPSLTSLTATGAPSGRVRRGPA